MPIQFQPALLGIALLVAIGTVAYEIYTNYSQSQAQQPRHGPPPRNRAYNPLPPPDDPSGSSGKPAGSRRRRNNTRQTDSTCTICLTNLDRNVVTLTCSHEFHQYCIEVWFTRERTCPICRSCNN